MKSAVFWIMILSAHGYAQTPATAGFQVSGTVVDHLSNRGLNHVLVQISRVGKGGGDASVLTLENGGFAFLHVAPGKYQLTAQKRGQLPEGYHSDEGYSTAVVVDGHTKTDDIMFALRTDASIDGTVLGDEGEPVRSAQVMLFYETVSDGVARTTQGRMASTNTSGQFHFAHLDTGRYYVAVSAALWFGQAVNMVYPITFYGDTQDAASTRPVNLQEGGSANLQINLRAAPMIKIKVPDGRIGVQPLVQGPGETLVPVLGGLSVVPSNAPSGVVAAAHGAGPAEMTGIPAGRYQVVFFHQNGLAMPPQEVDLTDGSILSPAQPTANNITGRVIVNGENAKNLALFLQREQEMTIQKPIAADGSFHLERVPPGAYGLQLNTPELFIDSVTAKGARFLHGKIEIPASGAVELAIHTQPATGLTTLQGIATNKQSAFAGAMVLLLPQDLANSQLLRRDQSDSDGSFTLPAILPGRYTLVAIENGRGLAYKSEAVIRPYLAAGVPLTFPLKSNEPIKVPVQARQP